MKLLVTGSSGLIGSEVVDYFCKLGCEVHGIDNNMRSDFFGPAGDTRWNQRRLCALHRRFQHHELDIRNRQDVKACLDQLKPDAVVHTAAQPSHDLAASRPFGWNISETLEDIFHEVGEAHAERAETKVKARKSEVRKPGNVRSTATARSAAAGR